MAKLTKQQASARTKKAWKKRRRRAYAGAAGAKVIQMHRRAVKNQYEWHRKNGEVIDIKGFNKHDMKHASKAFDAVEQNLRTDKRLSKHKLTIKQRHVNLHKTWWNGMYTHGQFGADQDFIVERMHKMAEDHAKNTGVKHDRAQWDKSYRRIARVQGVKKDQEFINVSRTHFRFAKGDDALGSLVHEMGHSIDHANDHLADSKKYRRAAGYRHNSGQATARAAYENSRSGADHTPKYKGYKGSYAGGSSAEHFAESTRVHMGFARKVDARNMTSPGQMSHFVDPKTDKFLRGHIYKGAADKTQHAHIVKKKGLHNHYDKFLVGGVVVAGAGYAGYKHHQRMKSDKDYARKVNKRKTQVKRKVSNAKASVQRRRRARV